MITQTPSPNKTTPTERPEPLRWLIPAALLLLFLSICCIGQVVIVILSPRNEASNLNLLSKDSADYSPWKMLLKFPPIAPGAVAAQAADRATEVAQALLSPTPLVLAQVPTSEVIVIAAAQNAPTTTPGSALVTPQPTVTPRPLALGPSATPVIGTVPPAATPVPTLVAIATTPTETPRPLTFTSTPSGGSPPTRTSTPAPATTTSSPQPVDTSTPVNVGRTPTREAPPETNTPAPPPANTGTPVPPPANTDTPVPPPANTGTPVPPHDTNTPVPPPSRTPTPVPPTPVPPTPVPPTLVPPTLVPPTSVPPTASNTPLPPTVTNTPTITPVPPTATDTPTATNTPTATSTSTPTNTPVPTPLPSCTIEPGQLKVVKLEANGNYIRAPGQPVDFTICILNDTNQPVAIQSVTDTLPATWDWGNLTCDTTSVPNNPNLACIGPSGPSDKQYSWGHQDNTLPLIISPQGRIELRIHGRYTASNPPCNGPESGGIGYKITLAGGAVLNLGNSACIKVP